MSLKKDIIGAEVQIGTNQAQAELAQLGKETAQYTNENERLRLIMKKLELQGKKNSDEWKKAKLNLDKNSLAIKENKLKMDEHRKAIGLTSLSMTQLAARMRTLSKLKRSATPDSAEWKKYNNELNTTKARYDQLNGRAKQTKGFLTSLKGAASGLLPAMGIATIVAGIGRAGKAIFDLTKQIQGETIRSTTVFGNQLGYVEEMANKVADKMGVTNREFVSMAANTADLLIPLDFSREAAAKMATEVQSLAGALDEWTAGKYGVAEVSNILTKATLGEMEQLKNLGIAIRQDSKEFINLVKLKKEDASVTDGQARAMATLELIYKKSTDAQAAYQLEGNKLLRWQKGVTLWWKNMKEGVSNYFIESAADKLSAEQQEANGLAIQLRSVNLEEGEREKILMRLNRLAPDLAKTITDEKANIEDLTAALSDYNNEMALKILIAEGDDDIAEQKAKVESYKKLSLKAEADLARQLKNSMSWFEKKAPSVKKYAEAILFDTQKSILQKAQELNTLALDNSALGNQALFHSLDSYRIFKRHYSEELHSLNLLVTKTNDSKEQWKAIFGGEEDPGGGKPPKALESLFAIQEKLLEQAKKLPTTTEAEIAERHKEIAVIEAKIKRLNELGKLNTKDQKAVEEFIKNITSQKTGYDKYFSEAGEGAWEAFIDAVEKSQLQKRIDFSIVPEFEDEEEDQFDPTTSYAIQQYQQTLEFKEILLNAQREKGLIGEQEYQDKLSEINKGGEEKRAHQKEQFAENAAMFADLGANLVFSLMDLELEKAGENEEKKKEIRKKYADIGFVTTSANIIANTALAIMKALAELGPIGGPIAAGLIGAAGAVQLGVANAQRKKIKGMKDGGYGETGASDDEVKGVYHANEFIANAQAVRNPYVKQVLDVIDMAQRSGTIATLNLPAVLGAGKQAGGYSPRAQAEPTENPQVSTVNTSLLNEIREHNNKTVEAIKKIVVVASIEQIEKEKENYVKIKSTSGL